MGYSKGSLILSEASLDDIPSLSAMFPRAYHNSTYFKKMMPDTPAIDRWWQESHRIAILDRKSHVIKVTDQENGQIVAMARWVLPRDDIGPQPASEEERWPEFPVDVDRSLSEPMFGDMAQNRKDTMKDRKHYCRS